MESVTNLVTRAPIQAEVIEPGQAIITVSIIVNHAELNEGPFDAGALTDHLAELIQGMKGVVDVATTVESC